LQHILFADPQVFRDVNRRRGALQLLAQVRHRFRDAQVQLLQAPVNPDRPTTIPEVPLQLSKHRGNGVVYKVDSPVGVEPVDGLDETDECHLAEVVEFLAALLEANGNPTGERSVCRDGIVTDTRALRIARLSAPHLGEELESAVVDVE
jgi:hypothetical protein